jgi:hypothetical protein
MVKFSHELRNFALERDCETEQGDEVWHLDAALHRAHVRLWQTRAVRERLLSEAARKADVTQPLTE